MHGQSSIQVAIANDKVWVRIFGRGSFLDSPQVKASVEKGLASGLDGAVIDLENCPAMDSTFMGTLTGLALRGNKGKPAEVLLVGVNARNRQLLHSLGLDHILSIVEDRKAKPDESSYTAPKDPENLSAPGQIRFTLEAHEILGEANPENILRFKDVLDFLREDLERSGTDEDS